MITSNNLILLSAGGTGGHMFPAIALAQDLTSRDYGVAFITDTRGNRYVGDQDYGPVYVIKAGTLPGGLIGKLKGVTAMGIGFLQARRLIKKLQPSVVVGFGGYPSVPGVFMAQRKKIPTIIHEQNAILGRANNFLAPRADRIALSLPLSRSLEETDEVRAVLTGNPVRDDISALYFKPYPPLSANGTVRLFIMGGSLGAQIFSDIVPQAVKALDESYRSRLEIVQQCREEDIESVRKTYDEIGITARLETFFDDVPQILEKTHLVISRSGASTVAEVSAAGRPAIFVPYPHHKDQQQTINAESVAKTGGAWVMPQSGFTAEALQTRLETFLQNPQTLFQAAEAARESGKPDATRRLGNLVTAIASGWDKDDKDAARILDLTQGRPV